MSRAAAQDRKTAPEDDNDKPFVNLRAARKFGRYAMYGELLYALDSDDKDITCCYDSCMPRVDTTQPVAARLALGEPRALRPGATANFQDLSSPKMNDATRSIVRAKERHNHG